MNNPQNEWQKEESELEFVSDPVCPLLYVPKPRPVDRPFITIIGSFIELQHTKDYLKQPLQFNQFELRAFTEIHTLGDTCLILNLNSYQMFMTEVGLLVGEWRRFYLPDQYSDLVRELVDEAKRIKQH